MAAPTRWPGGARTVLCVTVHVDGPSEEAGRGLNALGIHSRGRYAIRRGVRRYLDMFDRLGIPATFFVCGQDVETWPELYRDIHRAGHELAAHGYQHEGWDLGDAEPALLEKTHRIIADTVGEAPVGWCSPSGRKSHLTLPTLRRLGYRYDSSEKDDDLPYLLPAEAGQPDFAILPNNIVSLDDHPMYSIGRALASEVLENWIQELAAIEAGDGYVHLIIHPEANGGSGVPARAAAAEAFLRHAQARPGLTALRMKSLAEHCLADPDAWRNPRP